MPPLQGNQTKCVCVCQTTSRLTPGVSLNAVTALFYDAIHRTALKKAWTISLDNKLWSHDEDFFHPYDIINPLDANHGNYVLWVSNSNNAWTPDVGFKLMGLSDKWLGNGVLVKYRDANMDDRFPIDMDDPLPEWATPTWIKFKNTCVTCGKKGNKMPVCSLCRSVKYCSKDCQKAGWAAQIKLYLKNKVTVD